MDRSQRHRATPRRPSAPALFPTLGTGGTLAQRTAGSFIGSPLPPFRRTGNAPPSDAAMTITTNAMAGRARPARHCHY